ncbi:hypothetical protein [Pedobacter sp. MR2016-24]|uniref:hypothetical protein n=1 Tax=Pedobacter sp. MR2016-24 TaxID=2994466 RepID=UPI0022471770|nr:hypothetical protein [Pedobacter sp. MR2016-24]MCX2486601.1 hypothetical protein [Pedobacter sp. MR2016-24]
MIYNIYLIDTVAGNAIELDAANVDFTTEIKVAEVKDLLVRRDVITKDLSFQFSEINNRAFGYSNLTTKYIDEADNTPRLNANYNPQLGVGCEVYENGVLILKGILRLKSTKRGTYECTVTGTVKEFTMEIGDSLLTDIDLSDLKHIYNLDNITASWNATKDYVYPSLQYGVKFNHPDLSSVTNPFNILNFQPAVFVKSIFNRIFSKIGYTYEMKGDAQFLEIFNKLIVPNTRKSTTSSIIYTGATPVNVLKKIQRDNRTHEKIINQNNMVAVGIRFDASIVQTELFSRGAGFSMTPNAQSPRYTDVVFNVVKSFTSTAKFSYGLDYYFRSNVGMEMRVQLVSRGVINVDDNDGYNNFNGWNTEYEDIYILPYRQDYTTRTKEFVIPSTKYEVGKQYMLRATFYVNADVFQRDVLDYSFFQAELSFPSLVGQSVDVDTYVGSDITPQLPVAIKQLDFINSICSLFNLYKYVDKDNEKKIIFETYDSYYSLANDEKLIGSAQDWTRYIDYSGDYSNDSNLDIPKNYNFKWKTDKDFLNTTYQDRYNNASYSDLQVTDNRGITDKKEISLIFSPTITAGSYSTTNTPYFSLPLPYMYGINGGNTENIDTNIRLLIYNGTTISPNYTIMTEVFDNYHGVWNAPQTPASILAVASNYLFDSNGNAVFDLHFGQPKEVFFLKDAKYDNVKYSYSFYNRQINELKSANVTYLTCQMFLNEQIINQLDLKKPIFIDMGRNGYTYWKLLSVSYTNSESRSTVKLQKIL